MREVEQKINGCQKIVNQVRVATNTNCESSQGRDQQSQLCHVHLQHWLGADLRAQSFQTNFPDFQIPDFQISSQIFPDFSVYRKCL